MRRVKLRATEGAGRFLQVLVMGALGESRWRGVAAEPMIVAADVIITNSNRLTVAPQR